LVQVQEEEQKPKIMKNLFVALAILLSSCVSFKPEKKTHLNELTSKYRMYGVQNNPYYYFMMDSAGGPHLVRTHMFKSTKVIWIEKLERQ